MIELTRLNGSIYFLNPDWVISIEATPDTVVHLANNDSLLVKETPAEVTARFDAYKARVHAPIPTVVVKGPPEDDDS